MAYLEKTPAGPWAELIQKTLSSDQDQKTAQPSKKDGETIGGLETGAYEDEIPPEWGKPVRVKDRPVEEKPYKVSVYGNGVMTVSQDDEILMITAIEEYQGKGFD